MLKIFGWMSENELLIVIYVGLGFNFLQMAFTIIFNVQEFIFRSVQEEDPNFKTSAYVTAGIVFSTCSIMSIFGASITNKIGPRGTLVVGGVMHLIYNLQFLYLNEYLIYFGSFMRGLANGVTWTASGRYVTENSTKDTIVRNAGIYMFMLQLNKVIGNVYILARFTDHFKYEERMELYGVMAAVCFLACIIFATLPLALYNNPINVNFKNSLKRSGKHFINKDNLILLIHYCFLGTTFSFAAGMYGNCIGFTSLLPLAPMQRMSISGLFNGAGALVSGFLLGIIGKRIKTYSYVIIICCAFQLINFTLIALNFPNNSTKGTTKERGVLAPNIYIAMLCSFIDGFSGTTAYSMTCSLFAIIFKNSISEAHSILRIVMSVAIATQFFIAPYTKLHGTIGVLLALTILSMISFISVERRYVYSRMLEKKEKHVKFEDEPKPNTKDTPH